MVIALVVTPEGLPLAYEVHPSSNNNGKARRVWLMDRGVPTEDALTEMRAADPPMHYLVGTPKGRLTRLEKHWSPSRGKRRDPVCRSNCWHKRASSTSLPKAATVLPRSGQCGGAS